MHHWTSSPVRLGLATVFTATLVGLSVLPAQRMRIGSSNPTGVRAGTAYSTALFAAGDTTHGVELWAHNGTSTWRCLDVYPGPISGNPTEITRRSPLNGNTWFVARARASTGAQIGRELFFYPNLPTTAAGGWSKDLRPGSLGSHPTELTVLNGRLIFVANNGTHGRELWISGGTPASTFMLKDIRLGALGSYPHGLTVYNNRVYFAATTATGGTELWATNGTALGTVLVKDIEAGSRSSVPGDFEVFGKYLYFAASTRRNGRELWRTNGTAATTVLAADIEPGTRSSNPAQLTASATQMAFTASTKTIKRELYLMKTTGVWSRRSSFPRGESINQITAFGSQFYFRAYTKLRGYELWRTTATGVALAHDVRAGAASSFPHNLYAFGNNLLFRCDDGTRGEEYYRTNGTTATLIRDIRPGACASRPSVLTPMSSGGRPTLLFAAKGDKNGIELWQTNGVTAALVRNIDPLAVLPGMHWETTPTGGIGIDIKDAPVSAPGFVVIGGAVSRVYTIPQLRMRGATNISLAPGFFLLPFRTDSRGLARIQIPPFPIRTRSNITSQAAIEMPGGAIAMSAAPGACNEGFLHVTPPGGPRVEGRICLDDESGEYTYCALRTDANDVPAYLGLYQKGPGGDLDFLQCVPIGPGEFFEDAGQIEILLPLGPDDPTGRHLELHLFTDPPTPGSAGPGSLVTTSYC